MNTYSDMLKGKLFKMSPATPPTNAKGTHEKINKVCPILLKAA